MRWIARRKAAWVVSAWMTAIGANQAEDPVRPPATETLHPVLLGYEKAEPIGPPKAIAPEKIAAPKVIPPSAPAESFRPANPLPPVVPPPDVTSSRRMRITSDGPIPIVEQPFESIAPPKERGPKPREVKPLAPPSPPPNPWAKVPSVQVTPRLGNFLVPGSGSGYYSGLDQVTGSGHDKAPPQPYPPFALQPPSGFDADYRYLENPENTHHDIFDVLKRMHPSDDTMLTVGGQSSYRYMHEIDARLTAANNSYNLYRNRVWADFWYQDEFRVYGEFISALIAGNELPPLPIDENRADILNLFVEFKIGQFFGNPAYVRLGRQELLFGSQRLISTLDWANTRRTFEGARAYWRSEQIDFDVFGVRPVVIKPGDPDAANEDVKFYGAWLTFRPGKGQFIDLYCLGLSDDTYIQDPFRGPNAPMGTQQIHTYGARVAGNEGPFLFDFEGMVQRGTYVNRDHKAYAYTAAVGYEFQEVHWRPQAWIGCDYASGTADPLSGDHKTFQQLYPFGHYYFGFIDQVGRQNIKDLNLQLAAYPKNWVTLVTQLHHFKLAEELDSLYNAAGRPIRRDPTGRAGKDVGHEIDFLANFHLTPHQDLLIGYSKLFAGDFLRATGPNVSPELFYFMYNLRW